MVPVLDFKFGFRVLILGFGFLKAYGIWKF